MSDNICVSGAGCFLYHVFVQFDLKSLCVFDSAGEAAKHQHGPVLRVRVSAQDAHQATRRHSAVVRVVRPSEGTFID